MELFVDPGVVLLCEEFVVGVPGREEDLVGAGGGDELDADGPEFFFLFLEVRGWWGLRSGIKSVLNEDEVLLLRKKSLKMDTLKA